MTSAVKILLGLTEVIIMTSTHIKRASQRMLHKLKTSERHSMYQSEHNMFRYMKLNICRGTKLFKTLNSY